VRARSFNLFPVVWAGSLFLALILTFAAPATAVAQADLSFYNSPNLSVSSTGVWGGDVSIGVSVANTGATSGSFQVILYLENTDGSNPVQFETINFPPLQDDYYYGETFSVPLPRYIPAGLASGALNVQATIVLNGQAGQSSSAGTINVTAPLADLVGFNGQVNGVSYRFGVQQSVAAWGQPIGIEYAVINQTAGVAGPFTVNFYLCETSSFGTGNTPGSNTYYLGSFTSNGLQGGYFTSSATTSGSFGYNNFLLPSANPFTDGNTSFYIGMVINPTSNNTLTPIAESNYANDCDQGSGIDWAGPITITNPQPKLLASESNPPGNGNTLNFGNVADTGTGGAVGTQTVTLTDVGTGPLSVTGISTSGAAFRITNIVSSIQTLAQPVTFPRPIQENGSENWVVTVTYDATVVGAQTGSLTITSDDPVHPTTTIALSGTGVPVSQLSLLDPTPPYNDLNASYGGVVNDGLGGASSTLAFTLSDIGSGPLTISKNGITLTATASGVWSITSITSNTRGAINLSGSANTIAPNSAEKWSVAVKFDPTADTAYVTGLQVSSNDPNVPVTTCTLTGTGLIPMTLYVTDSIGSPTDHAMNFGALQATGKQSATGTVTLTDTGQLPLLIARSGIVLTSTTNFRITGIQSSTQGAINLSGTTGTIAPNQGETWTVGLVFDPVTTGSLTSQLNILSNNPTQGTVPVALSGAGLNQAGILVTAGTSSGTANLSLPYGPVLNDGPGDRIATHSVAIQDIGLQSLSIPQNGLAISGSAGFAIQSIVSSTQGTINLSASGATIAPKQAETWTATLAFDPTANIAYSGTLGIRSNDPVTPSVNVALSGTGDSPSITLQPMTAGPTLYIPAGQIYAINWSAAYTAGTAQISLYTVSGTNPISGKTQIASTPYTSGSASPSTYAWRPSASLAGQEFYIYGTILAGTVTNGSFSAQKVHIEPAGSFNLLSPLETTGTNYTYEYIYNGKVYAGVAQLQPGQNVINISTPLAGGGTATHQITVNEVASLLATQGYTYDELGRVKTYTNGNGIVTTYTYDFAGNLTQTAASNGNTVNYTYDPLGRRTSMIDSTGGTFYSYDDLDRVTSITYSASALLGAADNLVLQYGYDNASNITSMTYPGGEQIQYTYDGAGRLLTADDVTTGQNTSYVYSSTNGQLQSVTRANGVVTTYAYDNMGRVNDIKHVLGTKTLAEYAYTLNSLGNATALLTTSSNGSQAQTLYTYDSLSRLTQVVYGSTAVAGTNAKTVAYTYDGVGNRLTQTTTISGSVTQMLTYAYGSENRLLQVTDQNGNQVAAYSYDAAGNRIQMTTPAGDTFYTYDERNLLTSLLSPTDYITYAYNGAAQRVSKTLGWLDDDVRHRSEQQCFRECSGTLRRGDHKKSRVRTRQTRE
jgi:YD repeat-containing protein